MELEEKIKELIKWYIDAYGVSKCRARRDIEQILCDINLNKL